MLLCGDCSYASIENIVRSYDAIQLPHHGKPKQAEQILKKERTKSTPSMLFPTTQEIPMEVLIN